MKIQATAILVMGAWALAGCEEEGPLERAGEEIDETVENVRGGGESVGNRLDDAVDEIRDGVEDAADEVEDAAN